ncbi:transposase family protein [Kitasatospora sp. NPDC048407]|uniref:helix-turn-helix domain-containing protein n=1 Tax=Kitasatospora sp. NPDC048407 TaxID=3364051 RepID=UPI00371A2C16
MKYRGGRAPAASSPGRPWALSLEDRVLPVAVHYRTNLTMRRLAPLFGRSTTAAHRIIVERPPGQGLRRPRRLRPRPAVRLGTGHHARGPR